MMRTLLTVLSLSGMVLLATPALALDSDANQPINIVADRLDLNDLAGTAIYSGDVDMQQGSMQLTAQRVEIERNDQGEVTLVTATGDAERAYLEQRPAPENPLVKGWGKTIIYHAGERRVELVGNAELHQASDTFTGAYIEYFLDSRQVQARSQVQGAQNERVRMSLTPKSAEQ